MKTTTIAIVTDRYWPSRGGVEQAALALSMALPSDWPVRIITHRPSVGQSLHAAFTSHKEIPENDPAGRVIEALDPGMRGKLLLLPLLLWNLPILRKRMPRILYDVLYLWYRCAFFSRLEKHLAGSDTVHCISTGYLARCVTEVCLKNGLTFVHQPFIHFDRWGDSPAQLRAYAAADAVLCPTESFKTKFLDKTDAGFPVHVTVIPPIIIETKYPKLQVPPVPGRFILFLGRREAHKGLTELLVAFSGLEQIASLVIAGPGEQLHARNMAIFDLGEVEDQIKMWLLSSCDVFCVPSTDESFGIVFAEAMSVGKPIVSFDVAPVNEIVRNGENGILVPPDDAESLHDALECLLTDETLKKKMGQTSRIRFEERFAQEITTRKIIDLHRSLGIHHAKTP